LIRSAVGGVSKDECVQDLFSGPIITAIWARGRGGLAVMNGGRVTRVIHDISNTQFRSKFDNDLARFRGGCASSFFAILTISLSR